MTGIILAGGKQTRFPYEYQKGLFKPFGSAHLIHYAIERLQFLGADDIRVIASWANVRELALELRYSPVRVFIPDSRTIVEAIRGSAPRKSKERFIVTVCDMYLHFDFADLLPYHIENMESHVVFTVPETREVSKESGIVRFIGNELVFEEKTQNVDLVEHVMVGLYVFDSMVWDVWDEAFGKISISIPDLFNKLLELGQPVEVIDLKSINNDVQFFDLGTEEGISKFNNTSLPEIGVGNDRE